MVESGERGDLFQRESSFLSVHAKTRRHFFFARAPRCECDPPSVLLAAVFAIVGTGTREPSWLCSKNIVLFFPLRFWQ